MNSFHLKKSYSLIERKQQSTRTDHEQITQDNNPQQSPIEQLIRLKYNFTLRLKPQNLFYKPIKRPSYDNIQHLTVSKNSLENSIVNKNNLQNLAINSPHQSPNLSLKVNVLPEIEKNQHIFSSIFRSHQIKSQQNQHKKYFEKLKTKLTERQHQKSQSLFVDNYTFVKPPPKRNFNEYKNCIKKIQLNTTYRGFNTTNYRAKDKKLNNEMIQSSPNQQNDKINFGNENNKNERKRIINYMIERGFARKMEESLMKIRNEKKRIHDQILPLKTTQPMSPLINKPKRSVVFTLSPPIKSEIESEIKMEQKKEQSIDPW